MYTIIIIGLCVFCVLLLLFLKGYDERHDKNKYDIKIQNKMLNDSLWIKKVIDSCKTHEQIEAAENLIINWKNLYENNTDPLFRSKVFNELLEYNILKNRLC